MPPLKAEICQSIAAVDGDAWDKVVPPGDFWGNLATLRAVAAATPESNYWFIIVRSPTEPVLCAVLSTFDVDVSSLAGPGTRKVLHALGLPMLRTLMCGIPVSGGQRSLFTKNGPHWHESIEVLHTTMMAVAAIEKARLLLFKELEGTDARIARDLSHTFGYRIAATPHMYSLDVEWESFPEYLSSLRSHYRLDVKRSLKKAEQQDLRIQTLAGTDAIRVYTRERHALYLSVVNSALYRLEVLPRELFLALAEEFPEHVALSVASLRGRIVGLNWSQYDGETYRLLFCGLDYGVIREADVYFNLMYAELERAIALGARRIEFGQTAGSFKARLGCESSSRYVCHLARSPVLGSLLRIGDRSLFPRQEPAAYRVFKRP